MRLWLLRLALLCLTTASITTMTPVVAHAQSGELTVVALEVRGNRRVEGEAILRQMRTEAGAELDQRQIGADIRRIYDLGFFEDVVVYLRDDIGGVALIIEVDEKPAIREVRVEGNDELSTSDITEKMTIRAGLILDENAVRTTERRIEDLYREKGFFLAEVDYEIVRISDDEVDVIYRVREFDKVQVGDVIFVGNENISSRDLQRVMETRPRGYLSFLSRGGTFEQGKFSADLQRIRAYYYEFGYLDVQVGEPTVELSRDRTRLYLTIQINEGEPYSIGSADVRGDLIESSEEMMRFVRVENGERFSSSTLRGDVERITTHFKDLGYAFASVQPLTRVNEETREVHIVYEVVRGEIAHIGRIEIVGNHVTRDRVLRREMVIAEGDRYSTTAIQLSQRYVQRLGYFENVELREQRSEVDPGLVDLQIEVSERPTRTLQIGAGFSSFDGFIANAQISENNLFGRGQTLSFILNWSRRTRNFELSFIEPRLAGSRWQLSSSVFNRRFVFPRFQRDSVGGSIGVGYLLTRDLSLSLGFRAERISAEARGQDQFLSALFSQRNQLSVGPTAGLYYDTRDDRLFPTGGMYHGVRAELSDAAFGAEQNYIRTRVFTRFFWEPLWDNWVIRANIEYGHIASTRAGEATPITERFFLGGVQTIRGFNNFAISPCENRSRNSDPTASTICDEIGGHKALHMNLELEFPVVQALQLRGVVFLDAGNSFGLRDPIALRPDFTLDRADRTRQEYGNVLRTSVGFGFRWRSPIGPLRFEWGFPLARIPGEEPPMRFEFGIGNLF